MRKDKVLYWLLFMIAIMLTMKGFDALPVMQVLNMFILPALLLIFILIMFVGYPRDDDENK